MNSLPDVADPLNHSSRLEAWNPVTQKRAWSQATPGIEGGSVMATAGNLVFQGQLDGRFNAYAADTGALLWSYQANAPVFAPPISYMAGGRQYVTVLTGLTGHASLAGADLARFNVDYRTMERRVLTFVLDGKVKLPPSPFAPMPLVDDPDYTPNVTLAGRGGMIFGQNCSQCHGFFAVAGGGAPDLRKSPIILSANAFRNVVKGGGLLTAGMPKFAEFSQVDLDAARQYLRSRAAAGRAASTASVPR
jgi:quinohemoprotein ethanol dehydrogenase